MRPRPLFLLTGLLIAAVPAVEAQDVGAQPNFGDLQLKEAFLPDPQSVSVTSGGSIDVDRGSCSYGYVSNAPDVDLYYTTTGGSGLYIYAEGEGDTMLLINTPSGDWVCDDDSHGDLDPVVHFAGAADGLYNIWVGSFSNDNHAATLYVSEINPSGASSQSGAPDLSLDPLYGNVRLDGGFLPDPHTVSVRAGGSIEVDVGSCSYGFVANAPDVDLFYTPSGGRDLYIYVEGGEDTTLLINRPDGSWTCDDDGHTGTNPLVVLQKAEEGLYDIWVGTYGDDVSDATLYISERDPR
ncbi:MAG: hypothetical protein OEO79_02605 [Gemmatimonadota bacterium]|nr:hypothetical protein [Gemmatimonadota bacterium]MDH3421867.1 hypothetical protein [Gemmatimonadota bacterium]